MGSRDHSIECEVCGEYRGGLNDLLCACDGERKERAVKRKRIRDHAFHPSPCGRYCVHRAAYGWIANVACGWPKSAHVTKTMPHNPAPRAPEKEIEGG